MIAARYDMDGLRMQKRIVTCAARSRLICEAPACYYLMTFLVASSVVK